MPAPQVVSNTTALDSGNSITLDRPSSISNGDVLIACLRGQTSGATVDFTSAGWTRIGVPFSPSDAGSRLMGFYTKRISDIGSEPSSYTFTYTGTAGRLVGVMLGVTGVTLDVDFLAGFSNHSYGGEGVAGGGKNATSFPVETPCLQLTIGSNENTANNDHEPTTSPDFHTKVINAISPNIAISAGTRTNIWVGSRAIESGTSTDNAIFLWPASSGPGAQSVAILGVETPPVIRDNNNFLTVDQMLATPGFTVAHRGNSTIYSEMSAKAYEESRKNGYGALEFSVGRSVDGVYFGLHDENLNRTSGETGLPAVSTQTWSTIQTYPNYGVDGVDRGYQTLADFLVLNKDYVVFLDPKHIHNSHYDEFFEQFKGFPKDQVVIKFYFDNVTLFSKAKLKGYKTWGYLYPADFSRPDFLDVSNQVLPLLDIVGFPYDADQPFWDILLSQGKPMIAHTANNQSHYDIGMSKGASGVMVGASTTVPGVGRYEAPPNSSRLGLANETFAWLRILGYDGTIRDMEYAYLKGIINDSRIMSRNDMCLEVLGFVPDILEERMFPFI